MNRLASRPISEDEIEGYRRDGVVCLRGLFDADWVERLREAGEIVTRSPGPYGMKYGTEAHRGTFFGDMYMWTFNAGFRDFARLSPAAAIAGALMGADQVNFFFDHYFVKEPGSEARTPWHHDLTYWCVDGWQICTIWLALDPATRDNGAVEYVRGSHLWNRRFEAQDFLYKELFSNDALEKVPDIEARREAYDIVCFDVEPGDCIVHHALTVHGAPGNASGTRRRALATRWAGDDAVYVVRKGMSKPIRDPGLSPGAPLDCELFPVVWRREGAGEAISGREAC